MTTPLPTNLDATYPDTDDPSVKLHQQFHDQVHGFVNGHPGGGHSRLVPPASPTQNGMAAVVDRPATNLIPNPSFEVDLGGWTTRSGTAGAAPTLNRVAGGAVGDWRCDMVIPAGATDAYMETTRLSAVANAPYVLSGYLNATRNFDGNQLRFFAFFYDAAGALLPNASKNVEIYTRRHTRRHSFAFTAPANTASMVIALVKDNVDLGAATINTDGWQLERGEGLDNIPTSYLDGSMGPGYSWSGTPHASSSSRQGGVHNLTPGFNLEARRLYGLSLDVNRIFLAEETGHIAYGNKRGSIYIDDTRERNFPPAQAPGQGVRWDFVDNNALGLPGGSYSGVETLAPWGDDSGGGVHQVAYSAHNGAVWHRYGTRGGGWGGWRAVSVGDTGWNSASGFVNAWTHFDVNNPLQFRRLSSGLVIFRGAIKGGTMPAAAFTLPVNYRPGRYQRFVATPKVGTTVTPRVDIQTDGIVYVQSGDNTEYNLDPLTFYAEN